METLQILPEVDASRRFGSLQFGFDRIATVRSEFESLLKLASIVLGVEPEQVTLEAVNRAASQMAAPD